MENIKIGTIRSGKGDCIHIRFVGESGCAHNIIVDSGPASTSGKFRELIASIKAKSEELDILIITHYDEDHIGGILKTGDLGFKDIYFNAYNGRKQSGLLSATQNQRLFKILPEAKMHNSVLSGDVITLDGATITIHSPSKEQLLPAMEEMKKADVKLSSVSDWKLSLDELMDKPFKVTDSSIANRASIVFTFEYNSQNLLFCGDALPECIPKGEFELVKLPHHGSIKNISEEMLSGIQTHEFLICADGSAHPDKQTVAKLLQRYGKITVMSNYPWWNYNFLVKEDSKYIQSGKLMFKLVDM